MANHAKKKHATAADGRRTREPEFTYPEGESFHEEAKRSKGNGRSKVQVAKPPVGVQGRCVLNPNGTDVTQRSRGN